MSGVGPILQTGVSYAVMAVLAAWFALTILNQARWTRRFVSAIVSRDIGGLVPVWTFFAPNPGDTDTHLLFRDRDADGRVTAWREASAAGRRHVLDLWNPRRRIHKGIVDVIYDLTKRDPRTPHTSSPAPVSKRRMVSFPYVLLLNYVSQLPGDFGAIERQFAIVRTPGIAFRAQPNILFVTPFHKLS
jgi:hypothetical protein